VNELNWILGTSFFVLLLWFRFCLMREDQDLRLTFNTARQANMLPQSYHYLTASQVLTVPPNNHDGAARPLALLAKALYALPVSVDVVNYAFDVMGIGNAVIVSKLAALGTLSVGGALLLANLWLTVECYRCGRAIVGVWSEAASTIASARRN